MKATVQFARVHRVQHLRCREQAEQRDRTSSGVRCSTATTRSSPCLPCLPCLQRQHAAPLSSTKRSIAVLFACRARPVAFRRRLTCNSGGLRGAPTSKSESLKVLELTPEDAQDAKKVKTAFRRMALRYHPDVSGEATNDQFLRIQRAYDHLMRKDQFLEGELDQDGDSEWEDHDWFWEFRRNKGESRTQSKQQARRKVNQQLSGLKERARARKPKSPHAAGWQQRAQGFDMHKQWAPPTSADTASANQTATATADASADADSTAHAYAHAGPNAARSSSSDNHTRLDGQLAGLRRAAAIRRSHTKYQSSKWDYSEADWAESNPEARSVASEPRYTESELRFIRLAKLARVWRKDATGIDSAAARSASAQHGPACPVGAKPSARELLQAAVEGVALGACQ